MTQSDNLRGAALMAIAMAAFTLNDVCLKALSGDLHLSQVLFMRGMVTSVLIAVMAWKMGVFTLSIPARDRGLIFIRCLSEAGAAWFFLTALFNMPIANLTAILQALPLSVTLAGALFMGEAVGWRRMSAILVGFIGVMLIVRPEEGGFSIHALYGLATVGCATVRDLVTRRLSPDTPSLMVTLFTALSVGMFGAMMAFGATWIVPSPTDLSLILLASVLILVAYYTIIMSMRVGEIGFVAPFRYSGLLVALILGFVFWGEWPDALTLLGAGILVATGLYTLYRERVTGAAASQK